MFSTLPATSQLPAHTSMPFGGSLHVHFCHPDCASMTLAHASRKPNWLLWNCFCPSLIHSSPCGRNSIFKIKIRRSCICGFHLSHQPHLQPFSHPSQMGCIHSAPWLSCRFSSKCPTYPSTLYQAIFTHAVEFRMNSSKIFLQGSCPWPLRLC